MRPKELILFICIGLFGGLELTTAMSIANQDLERYFRSANASTALAAMTEDRIVMDLYTYAFINYSYTDTEYVEVNFNEEKARYGEGKIDTVHGKLVHITDFEDTNDDTACNTNIRGTNGKPTPTWGVTWIALVRRGRCTFEEKVRNVHAKGAAGVIIFNDKPVSHLEKMQIKGKNRNITAVITYQDIGIKMANIVDRGIDMTAHIIEGQSGMRPINSLNRTSVLFVSISFIVLMVISLVWLIFYYIQRFRYLQTKDQQSRQLCSVTKKAIMKIPTKTGKSTDEKDIDSDCCAICIESYKPSDCIRVLPCKHEFHKNCIDPWLIEHRTCPMCKLDVLKFYGFVFLGSEESILEYDPDRTGNSNDTNAANRINSPNQNANGISDLIRSRDFVIDFPRLFVMNPNGDTASTAATAEVPHMLFAARLPERSQSTISLAQTQAKEWMAQISNKLEEQQSRGGVGLRKFKKRNDDMQTNLLSVRSDSLRKRRSRSADGRYSCTLIGHKELSREQQELQNIAIDAHRSKIERRLQALTDATYALSKQRQNEVAQTPHVRRRSISQSAVTEIPLTDLTTTTTSRNTTATTAAAAVTVAFPRNIEEIRARQTNDSRESTPPVIQINDEKINID